MMRTRTGPNGLADKNINEIKRKTRWKFSAEEKIGIVLDGLRGESSISGLCRREEISASLYYNWLKEFLEAGKKRLSGDTQLQATSGEVTHLKREARDLRVTGWGWFYLPTILDDFSRYIIAWKLCTGMAATDVEDTLSLALEETGLDSSNVVHRPRLLSDNGPCYISGQLADYLGDIGMKHTRGAPYHPQTQGKIERWH